MAATTAAAAVAAVKGVATTCNELVLFFFVCGMWIEVLYKHAHPHPAGRASKLKERARAGILPRVSLYTRLYSFYLLLMVRHGRFSCSLAVEDAIYLRRLGKAGGGI